MIVVSLARTYDPDDFVVNSLVGQVVHLTSSSLVGQVVHLTSSSLVGQVVHLTSSSERPV
jgi:hypothetical protein